MSHDAFFFTRRGLSLLWPTGTMHAAHPVNVAIARCAHSLHTPVLRLTRDLFAERHCPGIESASFGFCMQIHACRLPPIGRVNVQAAGTIQTRVQTVPHRTGMKRLYGSVLGALLGLIHAAFACLLASTLSAQAGRLHIKLTPPPQRGLSPIRLVHAPPTVMENKAHRNTVRREPASSVSARVPTASPGDNVLIDATPPETIPAPYGRKPKNLVVCIDGTANQFGMKVCFVMESKI